MKTKKEKVRFILLLICLILYFIVVETGWFNTPINNEGNNTPSSEQQIVENKEDTALTLVEPTSSASLNNIPKFTNQPIVIINGNNPLFTDEEKQITYAFESYSDLDELGRCGVAYANICPELMPEDAREGIGSVKPSGWNNVKYTGIVDGGYLYNRCHLIGFQLAGENANKLNLITGTRYLNVVGMLPYENLVADYVKSTGNHVLYRVTPIYNGDELVCRGLTMEAYSVEDNGAGVKFYVYCYNNQPYITINYMDGSSSLTREVG